MAIVICKNCGAKVSDTCDKCIHCGFSLKEEVVVVKTEEEQPKEKEEVMYEVPIDLEQEFLDKNKSAMRYQQRLVDCKYYDRCSQWLFFFSIAVIIAMRYTSFMIKNKELFHFTAFFTVAVGIVALIGIILAFVYKKVMNKSAKKLIYHKMLQQWLKEEKQIVYKPRIVLEKDRKKFETLDLNYFKL